MEQRKRARISAWIMSVLTAIAFLLAGIPKALGIEAMVEQFAAWGYAEWFLRAIGIVEVVGAILLLIPRTAVYGAALLIMVMLGAIYTHFANGEAAQVFRPIIFLFVLVMIAQMRRQTAGTVRDISEPNH